MSAATQPLLAALDQEQTRIKTAADQGELRREYLGLLQANDPAKAGRLVEVAGLLGQSIDTVKADLSKVHAQMAAPPAPRAAVDTSKMTGHQLITHAVTEQNAAAAAAAAPKAPLPADAAKMNSQQLLAAGIAQRG